MEFYCAHHSIQFYYKYSVGIAAAKINIHAQKMEVNLEGKSKKCCSFLHIFFYFTTAVAYVSTFHAHSLSFTPYVLWLCCYFMMAIKHFFLTSSSMLNVNWQYIHVEEKWEKNIYFLGQCLRATIFLPFILLLPIFETDIIMKITM